MNRTAKARTSGIRVSRTSASNDAELSPFILDPSFVVLGQRLSSNHYDGTFLQTPVSIRITKSRLSALRLMHYMENLRHPSLEQLLGVVVDENAPQSMLVTSKTTGATIADILSHSHSATGCVISKDDIITIGVQASRALLFLHSSTNNAHPGLCPHVVVFDKHRSKTVVLLTLRCRECRADLCAPSTGGDVAALAEMLLALAQSQQQQQQQQRTQHGGNQPSFSNTVLKSLKFCVQTQSQDKLSMKKLCQVLSGKT